MRVRPVAITKSLLEDAPNLTAEELIVYTARVSNPDNQNNMGTAEKLLRFLMNKKHWSPFDMADLTIEVQTSRAIAQQILRHWSFRFQEFSQRYSPVAEGAIEPIELRMKGGTNRQGSVEGDFNPKINVDCGNDYVESEADLTVSDHIQYSYNLYRALLDAGTAPEVARMVLPLATTTTMYMKGSVRSWIFYFVQRLDTHAQKEHRLLAAEAFEIFKEHFPVVASIIVEHLLPTGKLSDR